MIPVYEEESSGREKVHFYTYDKVASAPGTAKYKIDCETSGAAIRAWTTISSPDTTNNIDLTPGDTTLQSQDNLEEQRLITVLADEGTDTQRYGYHRYIVRNRQPVT